MLSTNVVGILKVPCGWVVRDWNGFSHVLPIFVTGFQERITCANDTEYIISFSNSGEGRIRLVFLWRLLCIMVELVVVGLWYLRAQTGLGGACLQKN